MSLTILKQLSKTVLIFVISFLVFSDIYAQREDIVIMQNGDNITGEIKRLELGILILKTDDMETISIKWDKVRSVQTKNIYAIELQDGRVYYGSIWPGDIEGSLIIKGVTAENRLFMEFIVKITRIKESFWDILDGYIRLGASFTKASSVGQFSAGFSGNYRTKIFLAELTANSVITTTGDKPTSRKQDITFSYRRFLEKKWFWGALLSAEENTQLGIQLRTTLGGGIGKYFLQTNTNWFNGLAGLTLNREWFVDSTKAVNNIEGLINGEYKLFIYDHPKVSINTS
ncbi:MAG: DUF481 domain-containing protein, partial [Ignavibacteriaceae bacterium]|nr:DUF481 domain-containing protein [Ignavibacteriaceae bacterium]